MFFFVSLKYMIFSHFFSLICTKNQKKNLTYKKKNLLPDYRIQKLPQTTLDVTNQQTQLLNSIQFQKY